MLNFVAERRLRRITASAPSTLLFLGILLASLPAPLLAGPGIWTSGGPEGGGVFDLVASPTTPGVFYASTRSAVFKSTDGGVTWTDSSTGLTRAPGLLAHSQTAVDTLYTAGFRNVFFSNNGAATWQDRSPPAMLIADGIFSVSVSPIVPGRVYLGLANGSVLRSDDAGLTWIPTSPLPAVTSVITSVSASPSSPGTLLAAASNDGVSNARLFRSTDAGMSWTEILCGGSCPWGFNDLADIEYAGTSGKVWAISFAASYLSIDGGLTWNESVGAISTGGRYLAPNPGDDDELFVGGRLGLAFTLDNGMNWSDVLAGFPGNVMMEPAQSQQVVYDPFNTGIQLAGSLGNGVYRRMSAASTTWTPNVSGMNAALIRAVDTAGSNQLHAAIGDLFSPTFPNFFSNDGGMTWSQSNTGLGADQLRDITIDPNDNMVVYAGGLHFPQIDGMGMPTPGDGGLYKSTDGGITWMTIDTGIPIVPGGLSAFRTVRAITLDVLSGSSGGSGPLQTAYAGGGGRFTSDGMGGFNMDGARIYKSTDAGATWLPSDSGIGGAQANSFGTAIFASVVQIEQFPNPTTSAEANVLYAATFITGLDGVTTPTVPSGVFRTIDGGNNWVQMSNGLPRVGGDPLASHDNVLSLAIDPTDPTGLTLYASSNDSNNSFVGTIYKTTDGGANWTFSGTGLMGRDVRDLLVDPVTGNVYAAVTDPLSNGDGGVFISDDGGASWSSISVGFPAPAVALKLAIDNSGVNPVVHAGTSRSIQSFEVLPDDDTDSVPDTVEGNAPNSGDGNQDGMQDAQQADVSSVIVGDPNRGGPAYITAVLRPLTGACTNLENVTGLDNVGTVSPESSYILPFDGLQLRIPDCESAEIDLIYHEGNFDNAAQVRSYALEFPDEQRFRWRQLPGAVLNGDTWTFTLNDGQSGDSTPEDDVILFLGGGATLAEVFFTDGMEVE